MQNYWEHRNEINRLFNAPKYRTLKYAAVAVIGLAIMAELAMVIWFDEIPERLRLIIQGCVGVDAVIFVILVGILALRVFSDYFRNGNNAFRSKD